MSSFNEERSASPPSKGASGAPSVPGYDVLHVIGRGGMGVVWAAIEHRLERKVALKVHTATGDMSTERVAELWSEARLAAKVTHPGVVGVHDVGYTVDGRPYYTMDLVEGTSLRAILKEGALPQARALALAVEIADAVAAAHDRGVVHCDLKPANILVDAGGRPRILDFGLAIAMGVERPDLESVVRGSPPYISPEQAAASQPTAAADVYAMGVILYEMLTGEVPFSGQNFSELIYTILFDPPEPPTKHNPSLHGDIERVILKCLAKSPEDRFPSARILGRVLSALMTGRPIDDGVLGAEYVPRPRTLVQTTTTKPSRDEAPIHFQWSCKVRSPRGVLWPFVSNTDRMSRATGLPEVTFTSFPDARGGASKKGVSGAGLLRLEWDAPPYEWSREREASGHRAYRSGFLRGGWMRVMLVPTEDGGTEVIHDAWFTPAGFLAKLAILLVLKPSTIRVHREVYSRLDALLTSGSLDHEDPFEERHRPTASQQEHVATSARRLTKEQRFPAELVDALSSHLLYSPSKALERLRPYVLADAWGQKRPEVLDLLLHAANAGMVNIAWDLICPRCATPHETTQTLAEVTRTGSCATCAATFDRDLAASVELIFRPHREVRDVHQTTYCDSSPGNRPHVIAQQVLDPGEERVLVIDLSSGEHKVCGLRFSATQELSVSAAGFSSACEVELSSEGLQARPIVLKAGEVRFTLRNATDTEHVFRVEATEKRSDAVTAAAAMSHPAFHHFFSDELIAHGEHLMVSRMAFLFVDIDGSGDLLEELGDPGAFSLFHKLSEIFEKAVSSSQGAIMDVTLDQLSATFSAGRFAVQAALALQEAAEKEGIVPLVRAAVHEGRCIAVTRLGRLVYFGDTVRRAAALLKESPRGGLALSSAVADDFGVAMILHAANTTHEVTVQKEGAYKGRRVTRVSRRGAAGAMDQADRDS